VSHRFEGPIERVSIIVPMLNEAAHVGQLVDDLAAQDFSGDLEILVADGGSTDGSPDLLRAAADRAGLSVTLIDNPARWISPGLNACIRAATGDLIVRLDCHAHYPPDYVRRLVAAAEEETSAWSVGGVIVPVGRTATERAVACATSSPFGGIAWSRYDGSDKRVEVDTFYCGAFRPEAFRRVGLFDESLKRSQDDDLNFRFRQAGGKVVLDPAIRSYYIPRGSFRAAFRQYYGYGLWKVAVMRKHRRVVSVRSLAPLGLVTSLGVLAVAGLASADARRLLYAELAVYAVGAVVFGAASIHRRRERWSLLPRVAAVFPTYHFGYGLGLVAGGLKALAGARKPGSGDLRADGSDPIAGRAHG
jgi:succinoglycan biosynthesis protein ExoA